MEIKKPIFIVGTGRSGSTVFHDVFSRHPNVAWLSRLATDHPNDLRYNRYLLRLIDLPVIGNIIRSRIGPGEHYDFWNAHYKGFARPCRDLKQGDVTSKVKNKLPKVLSETLYSKRNRLLIKITGWPRIGFLKEIFPDAKFIHLVKDCRAVANSMINVPWWKGWRGPSNWRWGPLPPPYREIWESHNKSFIALACLEWKMLTDATKRASSKIPHEDYLEIKYEDLCEGPWEVFENVIRFSESWIQLPSATVKLSVVP